jgi:hypothetical protein
MNGRTYCLLAALGLIGIGALYYARFSALPGVSVSSWWRSPWKNVEVGGSWFSLHQLGLAWDLVPGTAYTQAQVIATGLPATIVPEGDHIHVQLF